MILTSFSLAAVSMSPACDSSWCSSLTPIHGKYCQLSAFAHMNVETRVMPQVWASSIKSICSRPVSGNLSMARGSYFPGIVIGTQPLPEFCRRCSMLRMPPRCASSLCLSSELTRPCRRRDVVLEEVEHALALGEQLLQLVVGQVRVLEDARVHLERIVDRGVRLIGAAVRDDAQRLLPFDAHAELERRKLRVVPMRPAMY